MFDPRFPSCLRPPLFVWLFLALACTRAGAADGLRVEVEGASPFILDTVVFEDNTPWYDAEEWLRHLPGVTSWEAESGRLNYREGELWIALRAEPPLALRDGAPLGEAVPPLRLAGGRLWISEAFLRNTAAVLLGRRVRVTSARDQAPHRVVIDAGHGGEQIGTRGEAGGSLALEKTVVLELALVTAEQLRRSGFAVHLTRSGDHSISDEKRAAVANYWGAELFVSLHAAGQGRPQARGFEIFIAPTPDSDRGGQRWEAAQADQGQTSRRWAESLQAALGSVLATFARGINIVPSPLLEAVACPAALVELGTLTWPGDAESLTTGAGREKIAAALVAAAQEYFAHSSP